MSQIEPKQSIQIGIIGDFNPDSEYHQATNRALSHAGGVLSAAVTCTWLPTPSLDQGAAETLEQFDGLWCAPGSPYQSTDGALRGIQFARESDLPFFGT